MSLKTIVSASTDVSSTRSSLKGSQVAISFGTVEIRDYERVYASDVWDVCYPVTLGWGFNQRPAMSVDEFERQLKRKKDMEFRKLGYSFLRRRTSFLVGKMTENTKTSSHYMEPLDGDRRRKLLMSFGYTEQEIKRAEKDRLLKLRHFMMM